MEKVRIGTVAALVEGDVITHPDHKGRFIYKQDDLWDAEEDGIVVAIIVLGIDPGDNETPFIHLHDDSEEDRCRLVYDVMLRHCTVYREV